MANSLEIYRVPFSIGSDHYVGNGFREESGDITWHIMLEKDYIEKYGSDLNAIIDHSTALIVVNVTDDFQMNVLKSPQEEMAKMVTRIMLMEVMRQAIPEVQEMSNQIKSYIRSARRKSTTVGEA